MGVIPTADKEVMQFCKGVAHLDEGVINLQKGVVNIHVGVKSKSKGVVLKSKGVVKYSMFTRESWKEKRSRVSSQRDLLCFYRENCIMLKGSLKL